MTGHLLCEAPEGPLRQKVPVTFPSPPKVPVTFSCPLTFSRHLARHDPRAPVLRQYLSGLVPRTAVRGRVQSLAADRSGRGRRVGGLGPLGTITPCTRFRTEVLARRPGLDRRRSKCRIGERAEIPSYRTQRAERGRIGPPRTGCPGRMPLAGRSSRLPVNRFGLRRIPSQVIMSAARSNCGGNRHAVPP